jgi:U3 small nucleolar RNA-associated protein MPP10
LRCAADAAKGKKKRPRLEGEDGFFDLDDMERFVNQAEDEDGGGRGKARSKASKKNAALLAEGEGAADEVDFVVKGAGEDDMDGLFSRNKKVCPFGIAYTNGAFTLLWERAGTKLQEKSLKKKSVDESRWIIFCDDEGVFGDKPYYESKGDFATGWQSGWRAVSGAAPVPTLDVRPAGEGGNFMDDDDEEMEAWEGEDDYVDEDDDEQQEGDEDEDDEDEDEDEEEDEEVGRPKKKGKSGKEIRFEDFFDDMKEDFEDEGEKAVVKNKSIKGEGGIDSKPKKARGGKQGAAKGAFFASPTFTGSKEGYVYKKGPEGLGYYIDKAMGYVVEDDEDEEEEESEEEEEEEEEEGDKSAFQLQQEKLAKQMAELEAKNLATRDWTLMGEASKGKRPDNALLDVPVEFDHATKARPVIDATTTQSIEEMIKQRCIDEKWDDPVRKVAASTKGKRQVEEVDDEKSKLGLGELYAKEYERQIFGAKEEDKYAKAHAEVEALFAKVCNRLDLLSNFHYTPKAVVDEITVRPNVPAITLEEKLPMGVSDAQALAPEEVYGKKAKTDQLKGDGDKTSEDRRRLRMAKKRKHKKGMQAKKEQMAAEGKKIMDSTTSAKVKATIKNGKDDANKHVSGGLAKSSTLFSALQAEAAGAAAGLKPAKAGGSKEVKRHGASFKL